MSPRPLLMLMNASWSQRECIESNVVLEANWGLSCSRSSDFVFHSLLVHYLNQANTSLGAS